MVTQQQSQCELWRVWFHGSCNSLLCLPLIEKEGGQCPTYLEITRPTKNQKISNKRALSKTWSYSKVESGLKSIPLLCKCTLKHRVSALVAANQTHAHISDRNGRRLPSAAL